MAGIHRRDKGRAGERRRGSHRPWREIIIRQPANRHDPLIDGPPVMHQPIEATSPYLIIGANIGLPDDLPDEMLA